MLDSADSEVVNHSQFQEESFQELYNEVFSKLSATFRSDMVGYLKVQLKENFSDEFINEYFSKENLPLVRERIAESLLVNAWLSAQMKFTTAVSGEIATVSAETVSLRFTISAFDSAGDLQNKYSFLQNAVEVFPGATCAVSDERVVVVTLRATQFYESKKEVLLEKFVALVGSPLVKSFDGCKQYLLPRFREYLKLKEQAAAASEAAASEAAFLACCIS